MLYELLKFDTNSSYLILKWHVRFILSQRFFRELSFSSVKNCHLEKMGPRLQSRAIWLTRQRGRKVALRTKFVLIMFCLLKKKETRSIQHCHKERELFWMNISNTFKKSLLRENEKKALIFWYFVGHWVNITSQWSCSMIFRIRKLGNINDSILKTVTQ